MMVALLFDQFPGTRTLAFGKGFQLQECAWVLDRCIRLKDCGKAVMEAKESDARVLDDSWRL